MAELGIDVSDLTAPARPFGVDKEIVNIEAELNKRYSQFKKDGLAKLKLDPEILRLKAEVAESKNKVTSGPQVDSYNVSVQNSRFFGRLKNLLNGATRKMDSAQVLLQKQSLAESNLYNALNTKIQDMNLNIRDLSTGLRFDKLNAKGVEDLFD